MCCVAIFLVWFTVLNQRPEPPLRRNKTATAKIPEALVIKPPLIYPSTNLLYYNTAEKGGNISFAKRKSMKIIFLQVSGFLLPVFYVNALVYLHNFVWRVGTHTHVQHTRTNGND